MFSTKKSNKIKLNQKSLALYQPQQRKAIIIFILHRDKWRTRELHSLLVSLSEMALTINEGEELTSKDGYIPI